MDAYAVLAGGGVKGAALAGCIAAAEALGVDFKGFGGTSAGSIVAFLASIGYSGDSLRTELVSRKFTEFLDHQGKHVLAWKEGAIRHPFLATSAIWRLMGNSGLYSGQALTEFLVAKARETEKFGDLQSADDLTFEKMAKAHCKSFRVVATDVTNKKAAVFPRDAKKYTPSAIKAVRASAGYPYVFRPVRLGESLVVDGGLASNLPAFLFLREYRNFRIPTFAFDLSSAGEPYGNPSPLSLGWQLMATMLEASDELIRSAIDGVVHIAVELPRSINTFSLDLNQDQRQSLFDAGYRQTTQFLSNFEPLRLAGDAEDTQFQLMTRFGSPALYAPILNALIRDMDDSTHAEDIRANIMLQTGHGKRIVVYQEGMDGAADSDLELDNNAGCSGQAWQERKPMIADLENASQKASWRMSSALHAKVPADRKSVISVPIPDTNGELSGLPSGPIGTLSVDSSTPLADTCWGDPDGAAITIMTTWAQVIARLLP